MKLNNIIVYALLVIASLVLLWLWFALGFVRIDGTLSIVLAVVWWVVIIAAIAVVVLVERNRRRKVRTIYVADDVLFNSEVGSLAYADPQTLISAMGKVLGNLKYGFEKKELPNEYAFPIKCVVRTDRFNASEWTGTVIRAQSHEVIPFADKAELFRIVSTT